MITKITTGFRYAALQFAGNLSRTAEELAAYSHSHFAARLWERVGNTGLALEGLMGRVADRCSIDICAYMIDRAYEV